MRLGQSNNRIRGNGAEIIETQDLKACQHCGEAQLKCRQEKTVKSLLATASHSRNGKTTLSLQRHKTVVTCKTRSSAKKNTGDLSVSSVPDSEYELSSTQYVTDNHEEEGETTLSSLSSSLELETVIDDSLGGTTNKENEKEDPMMIDTKDIDISPVHHSLKYLTIYNSSSEESDHEEESKCNNSESNTISVQPTQDVEMKDYPISARSSTRSITTRASARKQSINSIEELIKSPAPITLIKRKLSNASHTAATENNNNIPQDSSLQEAYPTTPRCNTRKRPKLLDNKVQPPPQKLNIDSKVKSPPVKEVEEVEFIGITTRAQQKRQQSQEIEQQQQPVNARKEERTCGTRQSSKSVKPVKKAVVERVKRPSRLIKKKPLKPNITPSTTSKAVKKSPAPVPKSPAPVKGKSKEPEPSHHVSKRLSKPVDNDDDEEDTQSILEICKRGQQIPAKDLVVLDTVLGEGQVGTVHLARYKGLLVACKSKRGKTRLSLFYFQIQRELKFAAKLSVCRYVNRYIGWTYCKRNHVETSSDIQNSTSYKLYIIQRYISNGDARSYLDKRESTFQPAEVLQASICLFSALTDAHRLGVGIVDLKLENFLIDSSGAGWLTDFGSCIEFNKRRVVNLDEEEVAWTKNVAAPEMISTHQFSKASDVFMATLIIAEILTVEFSDKEFYHEILKRNKFTGRVKFSPFKILARYQPFFSLLSLGLANEPENRPSASRVLEYLLQMKKRV